jgi:hypothetical protein
MAGTEWRDYEVLTQTILREAHLDQGVDSLTVEHDVTLQGNVLTHQIDVLIRFVKERVPHAVIVQCKDWNSTVKQEHLLAFAGVLNDLPDNPAGIFVTRKGYQAGAKKYAEAKNIILYTLRDRTAADIIIERIELNITGFHPWTSQPSIELDQAWLDQQPKARGVPSGEPIQVTIAGAEDGVMLCNEDGTPRQSFYQLKESLCTSMQEVPLHTVTQRFEEPTYVYTSGDARFPLVRLASVSYQVCVTPVRNHIVIESENIVAYILADVLGGATATFDRELHFVAHFHKWGEGRSGSGPS